MKWPCAPGLSRLQGRCPPRAGWPGHCTVRYPPRCWLRAWHGSGAVPCNGYSATRCPQCRPQRWQRWPHSLEDSGCRKPCCVGVCGQMGAMRAMCSGVIPRPGTHQMRWSPAPFLSMRRVVDAWARICARRAGRASRGASAPGRARRRRREMGPDSDARFRPPASSGLLRTRPSPRGRRTPGSPAARRC